jgi:predicted DNA-binding transcriptional regulator YafY
LATAAAHTSKPATRYTRLKSIMPGAAAELGLADLMTMARTKLMAALPAGARVERVATRFHLDAAGWFRATDSVTALPLIAGAVWNARFLRFRYGQVNDVGVRKVGPVGLVLKAGIWYLVAQKGRCVSHVPRKQDFESGSPG